MLGFRLLVWAWVVLASLGWAVPAEASAKNLLDGLSPARLESVRNADALTDGVQAPKGHGWNTELSTILKSRASHVDFDLGGAKPIDSAYLQGDNNDTYVLSASDDGKNFREIWQALPDDKPGMRQRSTSGLATQARYLRLTARGGDGSYAVTELQVFSAKPKPFPPRIPSREGTVAPARLRNSLLTFGMALAAFALFAYRGARWYWLAALSIVPIAAAFTLLEAIRIGWPVEARELSLLRSVTAAVALAALVRERLFPERYPAHRGAVLAVVGLSAVLSAASFYNLGRPQFWNNEKGQPEFVHQLDMRIYYPFAKYFHELGYDGVYQASIKAFSEDTDTPLDALGNVEIRSMTTHDSQRVSDVKAEIEKIPQRFTPERWESFKEDMSYFRRTMGDKHYLATHSDHGANATPVWTAMARPFFVFSEANETSLVIGGLADTVLLGLMFLAVGFTFGPRQAFLGLLVFGATNLYMFGTNWAGATLRHDWIAYIGFGVCALRRGWHVAAGVLLAFAVMIRAFPGIALAGVGFPAIVAFGERWFRERRMPNLVAHLKEHANAVRVVLAAVVTMVVLVVVTSALFSFGAWVEWSKKISMLDAGIGTNDVSLRALVAFGTDEPPYRALRARMPLYVTLFALYLGAAFWATRKGRLDQAALVALPLIVVIFNPANYYSHFICLLPLLGVELARKPRAFETADERPKLLDLEVSGPLLALCVAEYWTVLDPDFGRHFQYETVLTFAAFAWFFYNVLRSLNPELSLARPKTAP
ncbi:MAG TPA: discoidin domain-containing protein [Polyangiaceae bacterium]